MSLAGWLNRTYIVVTRERITVRHRPIPWLGNKEMQVSSLYRLITEKKVVRGNKGGSYVTCQVHAIRHDGGSTKLVDALQTQEQASFVKEQIEKYLGIEGVYAGGGS